MRGSESFMILRELLSEYRMRSIKEFADRARLSKSHAWHLWHGRAQLGLRLSRTIAQRTGIPLARLVDLEPTPPTPSRGRGGPRRQFFPPEEGGAAGAR